MATYAASGMILGLFAGISPGPLLVLVISESMSHGTRAGIKIALAPLITDTPIIIATILILNRLAGYTKMLGVLSIFGACYILYLAYEGWKSDAEVLKGERKETHGLFKGFMTNMLNPHPYIFWISVGAPLLLKAANEGMQAAASFIILFYICIVGSKIVIAVLVGRYRERFNRFYVIIQRVLSCILALFSCLFFYEGVTYLHL